MGPAQPDLARPAETGRRRSVEFIAENGDGAGVRLRKT